MDPEGIPSINLGPREDSLEPFMIVLVGVPGSGKRTFADMLVKGNPSRYVRMSQDKLKTRKKCERLCRGTLEKGKIPIIDRCTSRERHMYYQLNSTVVITSDPSLDDSCE